MTSIGRDSSRWQAPARSKYFHQHFPQLLNTWSPFNTLRHLSKSSSLSDLPLYVGRYKPLQARQQVFNYDQNPVCFWHADVFCQGTNTLATYPGWLPPTSPSRFPNPTHLPILKLEFPTSFKLATLLLFLLFLLLLLGSYFLWLLLLVLLVVVVVVVDWMIYCGIRVSWHCWLRSSLATVACWQVDTVDTDTTDTADRPNRHRQILSAKGAGRLPWSYV